MASWGGHQDTVSGSKRTSELGVKGQLTTADDGLRGITWLTAEGKAVSEDSRKGGVLWTPTSAGGVERRWWYERRERGGPGGAEGRKDFLQESPEEKLPLQPQNKAKL